MRATKSGYSRRNNIDRRSVLFFLPLHMNSFHGCIINQFRIGVQCKSE